MPSSDSGVLDWHTRLICPFRHARLNCPFRQHGSLHFADWAAEMLPIEEETAFPDCSPTFNPKPCSPNLFLPSKPAIKAIHSIEPSPIPSKTQSNHRIAKSV